MDKFNNLLILTRIYNPIGIFLLLWPTLSALFMASGGFPNIRVLTIFIFGTILMRTAGCVVNDLIDRNLDCFVERTKNRPIASNIVSPKEASILLSVLIIFCFILVIQFLRSFLGRSKSLFYTCNSTKFAHAPESPESPTSSPGRTTVTAHAFRMTAVCKANSFK
jgi:heme O synthase-like polyprenyltransferase